MSGQPRQEPLERQRSPLRAARKPDLLSAGTTGSLVDSGTAPSAQFEAGRICNEPGCKTVLSIYNATDHCAQHPANVVRLTTINGGGGFGHVLSRNRIKMRLGSDDGFGQK